MKESDAAGDFSATDNPVVGDQLDVEKAAPAELSLQSVDARLAALEKRDKSGKEELQNAVANVFAQLSEAPTNWHQATIYFMTSTAEEDASMRKLTPPMSLGGLVMVMLQITAAYSVVSGMVHPSCTSNTQCERPGFFCYTAPGKERGKCQMCGACDTL